MYRLAGVTKSYKGKRGTIDALDDISLEIESGEFVAVQGPTGGGKSTLLQMLGALDKPSFGVVEIAGKNLLDLSEKDLAALRAEKIGFVFQSFNLIPTLTAIENVETALVPHGMNKDERRAKAQAALEQVGLGERLSHLPSELSGGQQQRVAIARALVKNPEVLLADEPTGNLDESTRDDIIGLLIDLHKSQGITLILVTHDSHVAKKAKRRVVIREGKLAEAA